MAICDKPQSLLKETDSFKNKKKRFKFSKDKKNTRKIKTGELRIMYD